jgi:lysophospholipase L1-like esterase
MNSGIRARRPPLMVAAKVLVVVAVVLVLAPLGIAKDKNQGRWVGTWSASPQAAEAPIQINGQTVRQVVHTSVGGQDVRIRLSNAYGVTPLVIGSAHVALSAGGASIFGQTDRLLTFNGSHGIAIPAGAVVVSDPVALAVPPLTDLAISLYLPDTVAATTEHTLGLQTTNISGSGDFTGATDFAATPAYSFFFLSGVEVRASHQARAVVTLGDSVTDGAGSTPELNQRYPNLLAARLQSGPGTSQVAVLNAGVIGNRILHDLVGTGTLSRLDRDVLVQSSARYLIVLQGNADFLIPALIGNPAEIVTAAQVIQGHGQIIERAHAMGMKAYGGTLNPVEGYPFPGLWSADLEAKRQAVNLWIRTSNAYDAVIDFDKVLRDPSHPSRLLPAYDSGDHVHPNDTGYQAMSDAIDLGLFRDDN